MGSGPLNIRDLGSGPLNICTRDVGSGPLNICTRDVGSEPLNICTRDVGSGPLNICTRDVGSGPLNICTRDVGNTAEDLGLNRRAGANAITNHPPPVLFSSFFQNKKVFQRQKEPLLFPRSGKDGSYLEAHLTAGSIYTRNKVCALRVLRHRTTSWPTFIHLQCSGFVCCFPHNLRHESKERKSEEELHEHYCPPPHLINFERHMILSFKARPPLCCSNPVRSWESAHTHSVTLPQPSNRRHRGALRPPRGLHTAQHLRRAPRLRRATASRKETRLARRSAVYKNVPQDCVPQKYQTGCGFPPLFSPDVTPSTMLTTSSRRKVHRTARQIRQVRRPPVTTVRFCVPRCLRPVTPCGFKYTQLDPLLSPSPHPRHARTHSYTSKETIQFSTIYSTKRRESREHAICQQNAGTHISKEAIHFQQFSRYTAQNVQSAAHFHDSRTNAICLKKMISTNIFTGALEARGANSFQPHSLFQDLNLFHHDQSRKI